MIRSANGASRSRGQRQGLRIAVESDQPRLGTRSQQGLGVPAEAEGAVDQDARRQLARVSRAVLSRAGASRRDDLRQHDRDVPLGAASSSAISTLLRSRELLDRSRGSS